MANKDAADTRPALFQSSEDTLNRALSVEGVEISTLEELLARALGDQTALIMHQLDRWFEVLPAQISSPPRSPIAKQYLGHEAGNETPLSNQHQAPLNDSKDTPPSSSSDDFPIFSRVEAQLDESSVKCTLTANFEPKKDWKGWRFHQAVKMLPNGVVELRQEKSTPGVESDLIEVSPSTLIRVEVCADLRQGKDLPRALLRVLDFANARLCADTELVNGLSRVFLFVPHRINKVRIAVIASEPKVGFQFSLITVRVDTIDPESYFARQKKLALAPTIASMASIPSRRLVLEDAVLSLLLQCDKVRVFLNNYPDVPRFLNHPRVEVKRSQDWDDKGDAGKFGWIDFDEGLGYRIIVDDDLVFPPNFASQMSETVNRYGNRAIVGMHGVLLKQPVTNYYDPECRTVFHFQSALRHDRTCHVLGTNALCYFGPAVKMSWSDFMFRNMADIYLARYAQEHKLPMISPARPQNWVQQGSQEGGFETIYENSLKRTRSQFDSSFVQDALVKWIGPLTMQPNHRTKIIYLVLCSDISATNLLLRSWEQTRSLEYDWALILVAVSNDIELRGHVRGIKSGHELHIVELTTESVPDRIRDALSLATHLGCGMLCVSCDSANFLKGGWTKPLLEACALQSSSALFFEVTSDSEARSGPNRILVSTEFPLFVAAGGEFIQKVFPDDFYKGESSQVLSEWLRRLSDANKEAKVKPPRSPQALAQYIGSVGPPGAMLTELFLRSKLPLVKQSRESIPHTPSVTFNEFFNQIFVINLDRRKDRWQTVERRLNALDIRADRFAAVDGQLPSVAAEFASYLSAPLAKPGAAARSIKSSKSFFQDYDSEAARIAYIEQKDGKKAIQSAGAWGYLKTWERILEQILESRIPATLVLDDDVMFHRNARSYFTASLLGLPSNWLVFQLGTLQHHWTEDWISWKGSFLYQTNGSAVGSHAVGVNFDIAPFLLEYVRRMLLPFDTGALAAATRSFKDRCFVAYPNIAVQTLEDSSDISTSDFQKAEDYERIASRYRWTMSDYMT